MTGRRNGYWGDISVTGACYDGQGIPGRTDRPPHQPAPVYCHTNNRLHSLSARRMLWIIQPIKLFVLKDRRVVPVKEIIIIRRYCLYILKFVKPWVIYCLQVDGDPH